jgi:hypothetical protein
MRKRNSWSKNLNKRNRRRKINVFKNMSNKRNRNVRKEN